MTTKTVREFLIESAAARNMSLTEKKFKLDAADADVAVLTFSEYIEAAFSQQLDDEHSDEDSDYFDDVLLDCYVD